MKFIHFLVLVQVESRDEGKWHFSQICTVKASFKVKYKISDRKLHVLICFSVFMSNRIKSPIWLYWIKSILKIIYNSELSKWRLQRSLKFLQEGSGSPKEAELQLQAALMHRCCMNVAALVSVCLSSCRAAVADNRRLVVNKSKLKRKVQHVQKQFLWWHEEEKETKWEMQAGRDPSCLLCSGKTSPPHILTDCK